MSAAQCSRCEDIWTLVSGGTRTLEEISATLGRPVPSVHQHLAAHPATDLMRLITYAGAPLLPGDEPDQAGDAAPEPTTASADPNEAWCQSAVGLGCVLPDGHDGQHLPTPGVIGGLLEQLAALHTDRRVAAAAEDLRQALGRAESRAADLDRLEQLEAAHAELTEQIRRLAARLGLDAAEPADTASGRHDPDAATVRAWCTANQVPVSRTGRVGRDAIDAYLTAHQREAS